jgi:hypothetical protein
MGAQLDWFDESILICRLKGAFDYETYGVLEGQLPPMIASADDRVDLILYLTRGAALPRAPLREAAILLNILPQNAGVVVGVAESLWLSNWVSVGLASIALRGQTRLFAARTVLDAVERITRCRARFPSGG